MKYYTHVTNKQRFIIYYDKAKIWVHFNFYPNPAIVDTYTSKEVKKMMHDPNNLWMPRKSRLKSSDKIIKQFITELL